MLAIWTVLRHSRPRLAWFSVYTSCCITLHFLCCVSVLFPFYHIRVTGQLGVSKPFQQNKKPAKTICLCLGFYWYLERFEKNSVFFHRCMWQASKNRILQFLMPIIFCFLLEMGYLSTARLSYARSEPTPRSSSEFWLLGSLAQKYSGVHADLTQMDTIGIKPWSSRY